MVLRLNEWIDSSKKKLQDFLIVFSMDDTASDQRFSLMKIEVNDSQSLMVVVKTSVDVLKLDSNTSRITVSEDFVTVVLFTISTDVSRMRMST